MKQLTKDASKQDEINFLEEVASLIGEGTYLSSLFTERFTGWVEQKIKEDWSLDIMEVLKGNLDDISELETQVNRERVTSGNIQKLHEQEVKSHRQIAERHNVKVVGLEKEIQTLITNWNKTSEEVVRLKIKLREGEKEIIKLKAELYDLMKGN